MKSSQVSDGEHATVHYLPAADATESLPRRLTSFVGREDEVAGLRQAIRASRLVTVTGPGGVGKSRLAVESACQSALTSVWVELGAVAAPGQVGLMIANALRLRQEPGRSSAPCST